MPPLSTEIATVLGVSGEPAATPVELISSGLLAVLVLAAVYRWGTPAPRWAAEWLHLERIVGVVVVAPVLSLAAALARFDDTGLDRTVRHSADRTMWLARRADDVDSGGIDAGVRGVAVAVVRSAREAKRPQTGQLYQYYVQVIVLLLFAALLLIVVI